jgi:hypothetical protein
MIDALVDGLVGATQDAHRVRRMSRALTPVLDAADPGAAWQALDVSGRQAVARVLRTVTLLPAPTGAQTV